MKLFNFIVAYDIADAKRLKKVAKSLEKVAIRIQYSVFFYKDASKDELKNLVNTLESIIDHEKDDIRIYKANISKSLHLKSAINLKQPNIIGA